MNAEELSDLDEKQMRSFRTSVGWYERDLDRLLTTIESQKFGTPLDRLGMLILMLAEDSVKPERVIGLAAVAMSRLLDAKVES